MARQLRRPFVAFALSAGFLALTPFAVHAAPVIVVGTKSAACPYPQSATIQGAVTAATPGTIIEICAGTYAEQVSISKPLTLRGTNGTVIEPTDVAANFTGMASGQAIAAIILVQNTTDVNIQDLIVDGTNSGITGCSPDLIGIYYANASGDVRRVAVRNAKLSTTLDGCQSGSAILVQSANGGLSTVSIEGSSIHDYQKNGITANESGTRVTIDHNVINGVGPTTGAAQNGIQIGFGAIGSATNNAVANHIWAPCISLTQCETVAIGILVVGSDGVTVEHNTVGISQVGIAISANHGHVARNRVFDTQVADGIELAGNDSDARNNRVTNSGRAAIFIDGNNNVVSDNRINEASFGVLKQTGSAGNVITNNDFFNSIVTVQDPATATGKPSPYR